MNEKDFKLKFDEVLDASDHYIVIKDGREAIFDKDFEMINPDWFEYIFKVGKVFIFCKNNKYGLLDESGNVIVEAQYDQIDSFSSNFGELATCKDGKWGMIDDNGEVLIDFKYKSIYTNSMHSLVIAQNFDGKFGLITTDNKVILDFIYDDIDTYDEQLDKKLSSIKSEEEFIQNFGKILSDEDYDVEKFAAKLNNKQIIYEYSEKDGILCEVR